MRLTPYRDRLLQELCDREFAREYFLAAALANDRQTLQIVVRDILEAGSGMYPLVELTKVRMSDDAAVTTGNWGEYRVGGENITSLPVDYCLTGILIGPPRIGEGVMVLRLTRNGTNVPGVFESTEVRSLCNTSFVTMNSVYEWRVL